MRGILPCKSEKVQAKMYKDEGDDVNDARKRICVQNRNFQQRPSL